MVLAALSLVLLGAVGFVGYWHARNTIIDNASNHLFSVAFNRAKELDHWFEERKLEITLIANLPQVKSSVKRIVNGDASSRADSLALAEIIKAHRETYKLYGACGIIGLDGFLLVRSESCPCKDTDLSGMPVFQRGKVSTEAVLGDIYSLNDTTRMNLAKRIEDEEGNLLAVMVFRLYPRNTLNKLLADYAGLGATGETFLVGADSVMLTPSRHPEHPAELTHKMGIWGVTTCLQGKDTVGVYRSYMGEKVVGACIWMPEYRWVLIAEMTTREAFAPLYKVAWQFLLTLGMGMILVLVVSVFISRGLTMPIFNLAKASSAVTEGDLEIQLEPRSRDEIGSLTKQFNQMVSSLKKSREALEASHRLLLQAETLAAVGKFVASIVHEMRNPLSAVKMNVRILQRQGKLGESESEHLNIAAEQTLRLENMLKEILEYSKPVSPQIKKVDLTQVIDMVLSENRDSVERKKLKVSIDMPEGSSVADTDPDLLSRILANLLSNAVNASAEGSEIFIKLNSITPLSVSVIDKGKGMSPQVVQQLFKPFFTTREEGVGLGMCNVKKFTEVMGGTVMVQSEENKGTTVTIDMG